MRKAVSRKKAEKRGKKPEKRGQKPAYTPKKGDIKKKREEGRGKIIMAAAEDERRRSLGRAGKSCVHAARHVTACMKAAFLTETGSHRFRCLAYSGVLGVTSQ